MAVYMIARNAKKRPTLQHRMTGNKYSGVTSCGLTTSGWSRAYQTDPINAILCKKCQGVAS